MKTNNKLEQFLAVTFRKETYRKNDRAKWLIRWVLEDAVNYRSISAYEKALKRKGLKENTVRVRVMIAKRFNTWLKAVKKAVAA